MTNSNLTNDTTELTQLVETRYHDRHRAQVAKWVPLAATVERVIIDQAEPPAGLKGLLTQTQVELEALFQKEEVILLPAILAGQAPAPEPVIVMTWAGHDNRGQNAKKIWRLTSRLTLPLNACRGWMALATGLGGFLDNLQAHIRLENYMLFPKFQSAGAQNG